MSVGSRSRYWACQLVKLVGLGYFLALMLLFSGTWLSGSQHSSIALVMKAAAVTSITKEQNCSQSRVRSPSTAFEMTAPGWPPSVPAAPWQFPGVNGVNGSYSESDVTLTPWCNATFSKQHPLSAADYDRSFTPGGNCSMPHGLYDVLESGSRELVITVVGGSMTLGTNCLEGSMATNPRCPLYDRHCNNLLCAWPNKMHSRLQQLLPAARVSVRNKARPSWSYTTWLEAGVIDMLVDTDVLIIDLQVNSQICLRPGM